eukprot:g3433.t1
MTSLVSSTQTLKKDEDAENHNSSIFYKCGGRNVSDEEIVKTIQDANTAEELINAFKNSAAHPQLTKSKLLQAAKDKKSKVSCEIWTKDVAKIFGSALKSAKISESLTDRFVEVFHPQWKRWRCAKVLSRIKSIRKVETSTQNGDAGNNDKKLKLKNEKVEQNVDTSVSKTDTCKKNNDDKGDLKSAIKSKKSTHGEQARAAEVVESLEVQFFDGDSIYKVYANDTKELPYNSLPMLLAASEGNIIRLVALINNNSDNVILIRTGCSLLISLTVGNNSSIDRNVDRNQLLHETNCIEVACSLLADRKQFTEDGDTVESVLRVLLNLACSEYNIPRMCAANGIEMIISSMEIFPSHSGVQYAASKTIHNMAIENAEIANKSRTLGVEKLIHTAMKRFSSYDALQSWGTNTLNVVKRYATIKI